MAFPVIERELRLASRNYKNHVLRVFFVATGAFILIVNLKLAASLGNSASYYFVLSQALLFLHCAVEGVRATSDCLSEEERNGTLGLLFLTELKGIDVVLGKLTSTSLRSVYIFLAMLPLSGLTLLAGGATPQQFLWSNLILISFLFYCLSCGVFVSSRSIHEGKAGVVTAILIIAPCLLPEFISSLFGGASWLVAQSPWNKLEENSGEGLNSTPPTLEFFSLYLLACLLLLFFAGRRIEKLGSTVSLRRTKNNSGRSKWTRFFDSRELRRRKKCLESEPLRYLILRHRPVTWLALATGLLALVTGAANFFSGGYLEISHHLNFALVAQVCFYGILALLVFRTTGFFHSLREAGVLELLLTTSVTPKQMIREFSGVLNRIFIPPLVMWAIGMVLGSAGVTILGQGGPGFPSTAKLKEAGFEVLIIGGGYNSLKWVAMLCGLNGRKFGASVFNVICIALGIPGVCYLVASIVVSYRYQDAIPWIFGVLWPILFFIWCRQKLLRILATWGEQSTGRKEGGKRLTSIWRRVSEVAALAGRRIRQKRVPGRRL